jgi:hydrogenase expression/formation protein HypE
VKKQKIFPAGKLPPDFLSALIKKYSAPDKSLITGPGIGGDSAVIEFKGKCLLAKTDPVTFAGENIGHYAVHVNANDIAASGGVPRWFLASLLLPAGKFNRREIKKIFAQVHSASRSLGITLCGGHTEITSSVSRPVIAGSMLGEAERGKLTPSSAALPGDDILLTKGIALEGVSLIAGAAGSVLKKEFTKKEIAAMKNLIFDPGISVVEDALTASRSGGLHAMHDPTEGGISSALAEAALASGTGAEVEKEKIPVLDECAKLCEIFGLDPLGLISSGSLLLYCNPDASDDIISMLKKRRIPCSAIGKVTSGRGIFLLSGGKKRVMPRFERDEITKVLK